MLEWPTRRVSSVNKACLRSKSQLGDFSGLLKVWENGQGFVQCGTLRVFMSMRL
jgi:hypothetical protein